MTRICFGCAATDKTVLVLVGDVLYCRVCRANNQPAIKAPIAVKGEKPRKRVGNPGGGWHE